MHTTTLNIAVICEKVYFNLNEIEYNSTISTTNNAF